jgi:energy-coupling factor transport system permease protein
MALDITIGQYHNADSVVHRLDPRAKVTLLFVLIATAFFIDSTAGLLVLLAFMSLVTVFSSLPPRVVAKALIPVSFLLIFPLLFNLLFVEQGTTLIHWGIIHITDEGIYRAVFMTLRLFLLFFSAALLTLTTSPIALSDAIAAMLRPFERFGMPAYELSMMICIALRFIPTLLEDFDHIRKAQQARGAVFDRGGPFARLRAFLPCFVPLFAQSFRHAEALALAMESRCYHGGSNRTHYHVLKMHPRDAGAALICCALLATAILWL